MFWLIEIVKEHSHFQLYYWQIRTPFDETEGKEFPREVIELYDDVLKEVRPNLALSKSIEEAGNVGKRQFLFPIN